MESLGIWKAQKSTNPDIWNISYITSKTIVNSDLSYVDLISSRFVNCHRKTPCGELSMRSITIIIIIIIIIILLVPRQKHSIV